MSTICLHSCAATLLPFLPLGALLPPLQHCHSHVAEAERPLNGPGHTRLPGNSWACDVQARPHFRQDCNAGGSLVRRDCGVEDRLVRLSLAEHSQNRSNDGEALSSPEACDLPCLSSTAAFCAGANVESKTVVNGHVSASRASYLQQLGPLGFEELLAKIELVHRQVTSHLMLV